MDVKAGALNRRDVWTRRGLPGSELEMPLDEIAAEHVYRLMLVKMPISDLVDLETELEESVPESALDVLSETGSWANCVIVYHPEVESAIEETVAGIRHE